MTDNDRDRTDADADPRDECPVCVQTRCRCPRDEDETPRQGAGHPARGEPENLSEPNRGATDSAISQPQGDGDPRALEDVDMPDTGPGARVR